jgi:hypothetical protein
VNLETRIARLEAVHSPLRIVFCDLGETKEQACRRLGIMDPVQVIRWLADTESDLAPLPEPTPPAPPAPEPPPQLPVPAPPAIPTRAAEPARPTHPPTIRPPSAAGWT